MDVLTALISILLFLITLVSAVAAICTALAIFIVPLNILLNVRFAPGISRRAHSLRKLGLYIFGLSVGLAIISHDARIYIALKDNSNYERTEDSGLFDPVIAYTQGTYGIFANEINRKVDRVSRSWTDNKTVHEILYVPLYTFYTTENFALNFINPYYYDIPSAQALIRKTNWNGVALSAIGMGFASLLFFLSFFSTCNILFLCETVYKTIIASFAGSIFLYFCIWLLLPLLWFMVIVLFCVIAALFVLSMLNSKTSEEENKTAIYYNTHEEIWPRDSDDTHFP